MKKVIAIVVLSVLLFIFSAGMATVAINVSTT